MRRVESYRLKFARHFARARWGAVGLAVWVCGCAVPQRPGGGKEFHLQEPQTKAWYWLYLPKDAIEERGVDGKGVLRKRPLVVTCHGMKPFDSAHPQCREWQQEADRYGFVVCAPELLTPDLYSPLPLKTVNKSLERDERAILAILDEVMRTADVDPNAVLVTSWSYGGYVAHYMLNRHPDRFTCLAVRQSNFSADLLDPKTVPRYRDYRIAVFYTENDFAICQRESQEAAVWYTRHGFELTFEEFADKGHERTPSLAAAFFARDCGVQAKTPPLELAALRVKERPVLDRVDTRIAGMEPAMPEARPDRTVALPPVPPSRPEPREATVVATAEPPPAPPPSRPLPDNKTIATDTSPQTAKAYSPWRPADKEMPLRTRPMAPHSTTPAPAPAPVAKTAAAPANNPDPDPNNPVRVRLSSSIGIAPLVVSYSAALPDRIRRQAYYLWTDNDEPISNGSNGQVFLTAPGEHNIQVLVTTEDGQEYRAGRKVTVLERITAGASTR